MGHDALQPVWKLGWMSRLTILVEVQPQSSGSSSIGRSGIMCLDVNVHVIDGQVSHGESVLVHHPSRAVAASEA